MLIESLTLNQHGHHPALGSSLPTLSVSRDWDEPRVLDDSSHYGIICWCFVTSVTGGWRRLCLVSGKRSVTWEFWHSACDQGQVRGGFIMRYAMVSGGLGLIMEEQRSSCDNHSGADHWTLIRTPCVEFNESFPGHASRHTVCDLHSIKEWLHCFISSSAVDLTSAHYGLVFHPVTLHFCLERWSANPRKIITSMNRDLQHWKSSIRRDHK